MTLPAPRSMRGAPRLLDCFAIALRPVCRSGQPESMPWPSPFRFHVVPQRPSVSDVDSCCEREGRSVLMHCTCDVHGALHDCESTVGARIAAVRRRSRSSKRVRYRAVVRASTGVPNYWLNGGGSAHLFSVDLGSSIAFSVCTGGGRGGNTEPTCPPLRITTVSRITG
jgi:hypothetical protein